MSWSDNNADDDFTASGCEAEEEVEAEDTCRSSRARVFLVTTISFTFALTVVLVIISKTETVLIFRNKNGPFVAHIVLLWTTLSYRCCIETHSNFKYISILV